MATTRAVARARSDVAAAADDVQRARAAGPRRGRSSSSEPRAADRPPPRRMPTRSLGAGLSLGPADDDDNDGERKAEAEDEDDDGVQAVMDAFAEHGIDESNSGSDDEQLARGMATVDLDDEPADGKAERKSSRAAVSGSSVTPQHSRKRRRKREVTQPVITPHQLKPYKNLVGYSCDLCEQEVVFAWMAWWQVRLRRVSVMPRGPTGRRCYCCCCTMDTNANGYHTAGVHRPRAWPARRSHRRSSCTFPSFRVGRGDGCDRGSNEQLCIQQIQ